MQPLSSEHLLITYKTIQFRAGSKAKESVDNGIVHGKASRNLSYARPIPASPVCHSI